MFLFLLWGFLLWNVFVFFLYGLDKKRAIKGKWRISEKVLLSTSLLTGGLGALLGGHFFHHKTQKWYFQLSWYLGIGLIALMAYLVLPISSYF
ncbi:DUF1294 domain-containing protein [Streptococcus didelphis]|uniref:DUF1294 domain-containing protein n=1 Tax=Streptococcus didelphis TaxID=102886 RepID=A0ABY9LJ68_9STRE|nr:DUF1294 domain-containing protein [Streptococcus didelphis]WMB28836.1 DUF1294 domain-containing protein [Streptococcus didelphis]WMB30015.1 DUF1294 domain-containing protein [Streptococcus didelphis]